MLDSPDFDETIFDQASLEVYQVLLKHFDGFLAELERNAAIPVPEAIIVHEEQPYVTISLLIFGLTLTPRLSP